MKQPPPLEQFKAAAAMVCEVLDSTNFGKCTCYPGESCDACQSDDAAWLLGKDDQLEKLWRNAAAAFESGGGDG